VLPESYPLDFFSLLTGEDFFDLVYQSPCTAVSGPALLVSALPVAERSSVID
jgi:hypothetical protein